MSSDAPDSVVLKGTFLAYPFAQQTAPEQNPVIAPFPEWPTVITYDYDAPDLRVKTELSIAGFLGQFNFTTYHEDNTGWVQGVENPFFLFPTPQNTHYMTPERLAIEQREYIRL